MSDADIIEKVKIMSPEAGDLILIQIKKGCPAECLGTMSHLLGDLKGVNILFHSGEIEDVKILGKVRVS
jgi:hypothetical protein